MSAWGRMIRCCGRIAGFEGWVDLGDAGIVP
jgi:hypothetical protein